MVPGSRLNQGFIDRVLNDPKLLFSLVGGTGVILITAWALSTSLPDSKGKDPQAGQMAHVLPAPEASRSFEDPRALKPGESHMGVKKYSLDGGNFEPAKAADEERAEERDSAASAQGPESDATADAMKKFEEMQRQAESAGQGGGQGGAPAQAMAGELSAGAGSGAAGSGKNPGFVSTGFGGLGTPDPGEGGGPIGQSERLVAANSVGRMAPSAGGRDFTRRQAAVAGVGPAAGGRFASGASAGAGFSADTAGASGGLPGGVAPANSVAGATAPGFVSTPRESKPASSGGAGMGGGGSGGSGGGGSDGAAEQAGPALMRAAIVDQAKKDEAAVETYRLSAVNKVTGWVRAESNGIVTGLDRADRQLAQAQNTLSTAQRKYAAYPAAHDAIGRLLTTVKTDLRGELKEGRKNVAQGKNLVNPFPKGCANVIHVKQGRVTPGSSVGPGLDQLHGGYSQLKRTEEGLRFAAASVSQELPALAAGIAAGNPPTVPGNATLAAELRALAANVQGRLTTAADLLPNTLPQTAPPGAAVQAALSSGHDKIREREGLFKTNARRYPQLEATNRAMEFWTSASSLSGQAAGAFAFAAQNFESGIEAARTSARAYTDACAAAEVKQREIAPKAAAK